MGKENCLGSILVGNFVFDYFVGSFFEGLVVGVFAVDASGPIERALYLVA